MTMPRLYITRSAPGQWSMRAVAMNGADRSKEGPLWQCIKWCMWAK